MTRAYTAPAVRARCSAFAGRGHSFRANALIDCLESRVLFAVVPAGFVESAVGGAIGSGTAMQFAPDGRLFVAQQTGELRVIDTGGSLLATPFVDLNVNSVGERGLLGVAFAPDFAQTNHVYVYYTTADAPVHNRISRFTANGNVAAAGSEQVIMDLDNLSGATNHNGGALHFGVDGKLYVAVGDNANSANAQSLATRHGKMLRINRDGSIPADNPFFNSATGANRSIWALGLRNPFTFDVERGTGRMFINDVGSSGTGRREEVDLGVAGANYGWPGIEGTRTTQPLPSIGTYVDPTHAYNPAAEGGCAITGGAFYDPADPHFPAQYAGDYFFADFCGGWIRRLDTTGATPAVTGFATGAANPVDLKVGPDGSLFYLARGGGGGVFRISAEPAQRPTITAQPQPLTVDEGRPASFSVTATGPGPLTYQWQRNGVDILGATAASYTLPTAGEADNGAVFRAVVTSANGSMRSSSDASLTVTPDNAAPAVSAVFIGSTSWTTSFNNLLAPGGGGDAGFGFRIPAAGQTDELPWVNLNKVSIRFSEPVSVASDDLVIRGVSSATYAVAAFAYHAPSFTATWTIAPSSIRADKLRLDLNAGAGGVADLAANALDGEWTNPVAPSTSGDTFPSGNGSAGGDFRFRLNVLPGDVNRNGTVSAIDAQAVKLAQGASPAGSLYTVFKDVNGSGSIFGNDVNLVRGRQGTRLPAGEPAAATAAAAALVSTRRDAIARWRPADLLL